ncbi:hypothetical protein ACIO13_21425 [Streptomyces sp. NPDC087425]|uniref:hypothetical protein n=1 Tax=Streptomyces sp. NPDC087425 TaxID=3365787 RepID=UPI00382A3697
MERRRGRPARRRLGGVVRTEPPEAGQRPRTRGWLESAEAATGVSARLAEPVEAGPGLVAR